MTDGDTRIRCLDPSESMLQFARMIETRAKRKHQLGAIEDLLDASTTKRFDSIFMSYAFQYHHERREDAFFHRLAARLVSWLKPGGFLISLRTVSQGTSIGLPTERT